MHFFGSTKDCSSFPGSCEPPEKDVAGEQEHRGEGGADGGELEEEVCDDDIFQVMTWLQSLKKRRLILRRRTIYQWEICLVKKKGT